MRRLAHWNVTCFSAPRNLIDEARGVALDFRGAGIWDLLRLIKIVGCQLR
jgi:hypothetical protein